MVFFFIDSVIKPRAHVWHSEISKKPVVSGRRRRGPAAECHERPQLFKGQKKNQKNYLNIKKKKFLKKEQREKSVRVDCHLFLPETLCHSPPVCRAISAGADAICFLCAACRETMKLGDSFLVPTFQTLAIFLFV